ncbi:MAG: phosphopantothenate--cysteine ligase [Clostridiales Family XIII bacterium]|jgi:phosphopantothenate-cysteine ligase|nr:phosphopantothenate--cysteine ligase [Clostridiales Family XIII bacterium]
MNVLITAGGTAEKIDNVRSITNTSTGRLGCIIAEAFDRWEEIRTIFYVCGNRAVKPDVAKARIIQIEGTAELESAIVDICKDESVDAVVHAMAVSDYAVSAVTTKRALADSVMEALAERGTKDACFREQVAGLMNGSISVEAAESLRTIFSEFIGGARECGHGGKIPSSIDDLMICMKKTPKIISMLRELLPDALIIGFKLLDGADKKVLTDTARELLLRNRCDYVLANDLTGISADKHIGYLIGSGGESEYFSTKHEIAAGIVKAALEFKCVGAVQQNGTKCEK